MNSTIEKSNLLEHLDHSRSEERWNILPDEISRIEHFLSDYEASTYEKPWVTTIYFGGVKEDKDGKETIIPLRDVRVSLKARQFNRAPCVDPIRILDPLGEYIFEAKLRPIWDDISLKRRKYKARTTLAAINQSLFSGKYGTLDREGNFPLDLLPDILKRSGCKRFAPIGMVQYLRRHYSNDGTLDMSEGQRLTFDTNFSIWDIDWTGYCYAATKVKLYDHGILEIKNQGGRPKYPESIQKIILELPIAQSKHDLLFDTVGGHLGMVAEVDYQLQKEGWTINEREIKIDVSNDPRAWMEQLQLSHKYLLTSPDKQQLTRQQFFLLEDKTKSACLMEYLSVDLSSNIKAKKLTGDSKSYQSRTELVRHDNAENRKLISNFLGFDIDKFPLSSKFERRRVLRSLVNQSSGRVFEIIADCCVAEDGRPDLNQVEIEYIGTLTGFSQASDVILSLDDDLANIRLELENSLLIHGYMLKQSETTKSKWISSIY